MAYLLRTAYGTPVKVEATILTSPEQVLADALTAIYPPGCIGPEYGDADAHLANCLVSRFDMEIISYGEVPNYPTGRVY